MLKRWVEEIYPGRRPLIIRSNTNKCFSPAERTQAVRDLCNRRGTALKVAQNIGVSVPVLYKWKKDLIAVSLDIESMVTPVFATLIFDDIIGLLKSIRRLNRATMSSAPDEPQKNYTASDEPFRYTGSSTGRSAVCIINDEHSQNQISDCFNYLLL